MTKITEEIAVVGGVGSFAINSRFKQQQVCIVFLGVGTPRFDYYTLDATGNVIGGKANASGDVTDFVVLADTRGGSFEIINATIDGSYRVTISSELAPTARVAR